MNISSANDNFSMKFDTGGRSSWPLPPSSVFKCRSAKPWINPEMFLAKSSTFDYTQSGMLIMGDFPETVDEKQRHSFTSNEEPEAIYCEVEVFGLPLPNSKIKVIEYSNNPEKGIDPGDENVSSSNKYTRNPRGGNRRISRENSTEIERVDNYYNNHSSSYQAKENGNLKKKLCPPFTKEQRSLKKLFY